MGMNIRNILKLLLNSTRCYFVPNVIHTQVSLWRERIQLKEEFLFEIFAVLCVPVVYRIACK